jgi:hypothetical protein
MKKGGGDDEGPGGEGDHPEPEIDEMRSQRDVILKRYIQVRRREEKSQHVYGWRMTHMSVWLMWLWCIGDGEEGCNAGSHGSSVLLHLGRHLLQQRRGGGGGSLHRRGGARSAQRGGGGGHCRP